MDKVEVTLVERDRENSTWQVVLISGIGDDLAFKALRKDWREVRLSTGDLGKGRSPYASTVGCSSFRCSRPLSRLSSLDSGNPERAP